MKVQTVLFFGLLGATHAQLPDIDLPGVDLTGSSIQNIIENFGSDIIDEIEDFVGIDLFTGADDFSIFNAALGLLVPLVNSIVREQLEVFDPIDPEIDETVEIGDIELPLGICTAGASFRFALDPITGISDTEIDTLKLTREKINFGLNTKFRFTVKFKSSFASEGFKSGLDFDFSSKVCGNSVSLQTAADLDITGPMIELEFDVKGKLKNFGTRLEVKQIKLMNTKVFHDEVVSTLDATDFDLTEAAEMEQYMSDVIEPQIEFEESLIASSIETEGNEKFSATTPIIFKLL